MIRSQILIQPGQIHKKSLRNYETVFQIQFVDLLVRVYGSTESDHNKGSIGQ